MNNIYSSIVVIGWIATVLFGAIFCKRIWPHQKELSRKIVHIGTGPILPLAWWLEIPQNLAVGIASLITILLLINNRLSLLPEVESIKRKSYGTVAYGLTITILLSIFWQKNPEIVCIGVLVMAFGDGLAGLIGQNVSSPKWKVWGQTKSIVGTITLALVSFTIFGVFNEITDVHLNYQHLLAITIATVGLEQMSMWGLDNLTVPIGVSFAWAWLISQ